MNAFTSESTQHEIGFSGTVDSKGRVTIPARIRNRLSLNQGDLVKVRLDCSKVVTEEVGSREEALKFIESFDSVRSFSYEAGVVEVVLSE